MKQAPSDSPWTEWLDRSRWALEPTLGVIFLIAWAFGSLRTSSIPALASIVVLAAAIAVSRLSPAGALAAGAVALLLQLTGLVPGITGAEWAYLIAGMVVVFATAAYGSPFVRWLGFAAAIVLTLVMAFIMITVVYLPDAVGLTPEGYAGAFVRRLVPYAVVGSILAVLLVGAWFLGVIVNRRAAAPGVKRSAAERWLTRQDVWTADAIAGRDTPASDELAAPTGDAQTEDADTGLFRPLTKPQLVVDVAIAVLFGVLCLLASAVGSVAELVVLLTLAVALAFRRAAPLIALGTVWVAAITQIAFQLPVITADIAILVVLYATAAYGGRITRWGGLASAGVGAVVAAGYLTLFRYGPDSLEALFEQGDLAGTVTNFVTLLVASAGVLGLAWTLGFLMRTWRRARVSRSRAAAAIDHQRVAERNVVVEQERNRIARDMHDVVAHSLAVVIAQADGARYAKVSDPSAVDTALTTIAATAREALGDVRILLGQLRKDEAGGPQPVLADLPRLLEQMGSAGLAIAWSETGTPLPLGSGGQLAVYRIVQEALTNALRHGQPDTEVVGSLAWDDAGVTVMVDNAVPSAAAAALEHAGVGHGLPGMRERAVLAGGTLTVDTPPGRFRVIAYIPAAATGIPLAVPMPVRPTVTDPSEGAQQ
ncbi:MAG TPA: histidine kinase [Glaciibacter sp.]|nr:histidine kinase [Glaciibacter sp.]